LTIVTVTLHLYQAADSQLTFSSCPSVISRLWSVRYWACSWTSD